jgi:hypothetical protein
MRPPDRIASTSKGVLKVTGAVNVVEQGAITRPYSPSWDVSFGRKCQVRNLIGYDGDHVMLQCRKLMALALDERREVLEKSRLCTFCLKHAAELECYGRGGMSKPRCTQSGCDGEHTPSVHRLMAEEHANVNLIAEGDSEYENEDEEEEEYENREEDEGWWVGTIGAVEVPSQEEEIPSEADEQEPEYPPSDYFSGEIAGDGRWSPGPIQPYPVGGKAGTEQPQSGWLLHTGATAATDGPPITTPLGCQAKEVEEEAKIKHGSEVGRS